jgi:hypothetical protein
MTNKTRFTDANVDDGARSTLACFAVRPSDY